MAKQYQQGLSEAVYKCIDHPHMVVLLSVILQCGDHPLIHLCHYVFPLPSPFKTPVMQGQRAHTDMMGGNDTWPMNIFFLDIYGLDNEGMMLNQLSPKSTRVLS